MRNEPASVDGVARKAAADVIVDAALAEVEERRLHGVPERFVAGAQEAPPQHVENDRIRKFRGAGKTAALHVPDREDGPPGGIEDARIRRLAEADEASDSYDAGGTELTDEEGRVVDSEGADE